MLITFSKLHSRWLNGQYICTGSGNGYIRSGQMMIKLTQSQCATSYEQHRFDWQNFSNTELTSAPVENQVLTWPVVGRPSGTHFSEILIWLWTFPFKKMPLEISSAKCCPFCVDLNVFSKSEPWVSSLCWQAFIYYVCGRAWWRTPHSLSVILFNGELHCHNARQ